MTGGRDPVNGRGRISILVVDDEAASRQAVERLATPLGIACTPAASVREALARTRLRHYDLALIDTVMPDSDGIELLLRFKMLLPNMPVLVMCSGGRTRTRDLLTLARQLGADGTLVKPIEATAFRICLEKVLSPVPVPPSHTGGVTAAAARTVSE